jgi:site-specific recombinase XerD
MRRLPALPRPTVPALALQEAESAAAEYARGSRAASTWRAYESDWRIFAAWCRSVGQPALPATPHTVALFLAAQAALGHAPNTLDRRRAAIRLMHVGAKHPSPHDALEVDEVLRGVRRAWKQPPHQKAPAVDAEVRRLADAIEPRTLQGLRDRALVLLGFAGALRRSELVALDVEHLERCPEGFLMRIASSKTDQEGQGQVVAIARVPGSSYCPVQAVLDWLVVAEIGSGAVYRRMRRGDTLGGSRLTDQSVALVIKKLALRAGLEPGRYAGHSLRSGFLTSAARRRASIFKMADQSRHRSLDTLRTYVRDAERFENHAGEGLLEAARERSHDGQG